MRQTLLIALLLCVLSMQKTLAQSRIARPEREMTLEQHQNESKWRRNAAKSLKEVIQQGNESWEQRYNKGKTEGESPCPTKPVTIQC